MTTISSPRPARPLPSPPEHSSLAATPTQSTSASTSTSAAAITTVASASSFDPNEPPACNGCKKGLEETGDSVVVSFGNSLWHVDCRCAKCRNLVEHDTNLLLLSDGSPVCENCSYICSVCEKPISNEAIVTGDESYHADCFRCRSCSNKIEELIFAKTSAGIWCMACHNERVARSRKHAESKRSKSLRKKTREASAGTPTTATTPRTGGSDGFEIPVVGSTGEKAVSPFEISTGSSRSRNHHHHHPPQQPRPKTSPTTSTFPTSTLPSSSASSTSTAIAPRPRFHSETSSATLTSLLIDHQESTSSPAPPSSVLINGEEQPRRGESPGGRPPFRTYDSGPSNLSSSPVLGSGLTAPKPDKSANRRSGFYGSMMGGSPAAGFGGESALVTTPVVVEPVTEGKEKEEEATQVVIVQEEIDRIEDRVEKEEKEKSWLPELHNSMSFYDPDTLLFLDHVGSDSGGGNRSDSPAALVVPSVNQGGGGRRTIGILEEVEEERRDGTEDESEATGGEDEEAQEHLSPDVSAGGVAEDGKRDSDGVERKVRESIRRSKDKGLGMDVELFEVLLMELEETKGEMKRLAGKYNAFRRASRSAFEGFSQAREEYDKEVAARREVEAAMDELRTTFTEQAMRLAAFDKDQRNSEMLKSKSKELRVSVVGMEKHLSALKAEVELETAHMEELNKKNDGSFSRNVTSPSSTPTPANLERSLTVRLESVKDAHRREIEALVQERDALAREIVELAQTRDMFAEENATLIKRKEALKDANEEAGRQLENAKETITKLRSPGFHPSSLASSGFAGLTGGSHKHSPSVASTQSNSAGGINERSPLGISSRPNGSPDLDSKLEWTSRTTELNNNEYQAPAVVKKFKWGKSTKHEVARPNHHAKDNLSNVLLVAGSSASTSMSNTGANGSGSKSSSPMGRTNGSSDLTSRAHMFQQTSILRPVRCEYCGDKMWGLNEVRCTACGCYSHAKCAGYLQSSCGLPTFLQGQDDTLNFTQNGQGIFGNDLTIQARLEDRHVPLVVSKCIAAVESYGMNYEGIYRKTGGMTQTKLITQCFERGADFDLDDLDRFNDLAAVTSCMKNYFRSLPDPLFTHDLHEQFVSCAEMADGEGRLVALETALYKLPEAHFYTARALLIHLHRVHLRSSENKMTPANLGVVFGPTVLRSRHASREFSDMGFKAKLVELMVEQQPRLFTKPYYVSPLAEDS